MVKKVWYIYQIIEVSWVFILLISFLSILYLRKLANNSQQLFKSYSDNVIFLIFAASVISCIILLIRGVDPYGVNDIYSKSVGTICVVYVACILYVVQSRTAYIAIKLGMKVNFNERTSKFFSEKFLKLFGHFSNISILFLFLWGTLLWIFILSDFTDSAFLLRTSFTLFYGPLLFINSVVAVIFYSAFKKLVHNVHHTRSVSMHSQISQSKTSNSSNASKMTSLITTQVLSVFILVAIVVSPTSIYTSVKSLIAHEKYDDTYPNYETDSFHRSVITNWAELVALTLMFGYFYSHFKASKSLSRQSSSRRIELSPRSTKTTSQFQYGNSKHSKTQSSDLDSTEQYYPATV